MAKALLINAEENTLTIVETPSEDALYFIQEAVGGYIDAVRGEDIVGYVNDEGLLMGLPYNTLASILFGRHLVGDVLVVGSFSESGEYDGADYNIPEWLVGLAEQYMAENFDTPLV
jgi:hypothetical protein